MWCDAIDLIPASWMQLLWLHVNIWTPIRTVILCYSLKFVYFLIVDVHFCSGTSCELMTKCNIIAFWVWSFKGWTLQHCHSLVSGWEQTLLIVKRRCFVWLKNKRHAIGGPLWVWKGCDGLMEKPKDRWLCAVGRCLSCQTERPRTISYSTLVAIEKKEKIWISELCKSLWFAIKRQRRQATN